MQEIYYWVKSDKIGCEHNGKGEIKDKYPVSDMTENVPHFWHGWIELSFIKIGK